MSLRSLLPDYVKDFMRPAYGVWKQYFQRRSFSSPESGSPVHLNLAFTFRCVAACPHCYFLQKDYAFDKGAQISGTMIEWILEASFAQKIASATCGGGEALLHPDFFDLIKVIRRRVPHIQVVTNGLSLQNDKIMQNLLKQEELANIHVSLDAVDETGYVEAKGLKSADFQGICANIRTITEHFRDNSKVRIGASFVVTPDNTSRIAEMIALAEKLGVSYCHLTTLHIIKPDADMSGNGDEMPAEYNKVLGNEKYRVNVILQPPLLKKYLQYYCDSLNSHLCMSPDGIIAPCCHIPWDVRYGEVLHTSGNPVNNPLIMAMRRSFVEAGQRGDDTLLLGECRNCNRRLRGAYHFLANRGRWHFA
jgi:MoaA/NifB/PqqE/SkfB family radical SAM enzyme